MGRGEAWGRLSSCGALAVGLTFLIILEGLHNKEGFLNFTQAAQKHAGQFRRQ
jgi:hypothetical protein